MTRGFIDEPLHCRDGKDLIRRKSKMLKYPQPTIETKIEIQQVPQRIEDNDKFNDWCEE
jgi:hypothetical protein